MRFLVGDIVRIRKGHRAKESYPRDYTIRSIGYTGTSPDPACIKITVCFGWLFRPSSLRLVRRSQ